jgi:alkylation response protein AidB-like acyl-CoA dehydrogenase
MDFKLTAEQEALRRRARDLADGTFRERAAGWDATEQYPWDNVKDLVRAGFMGLTIPREYGGAGASSARVTRSVAADPASGSVIAMAGLSPSSTQGK